MCVTLDRVCYCVPPAASKSNRGTRIAVFLAAASPPRSLLLQHGGGGGGVRRVLEADAELAPLLRRAVQHETCQAALLAHLMRASVHAD